MASLKAIFSKVLSFPKRLFFKIRNNDIAVKIYLSYTLVLLLISLLTGLIFIRMYRHNYLSSYTSLLERQGEAISAKVSSFEKKGRVGQFQRYISYIDEMEGAENTDVWIISNENAKNPLGEEYTNTSSDADGVTLTGEMNEVLSAAYDGGTGYNSSYDDVYGMAILRVALPIRRKATGEISGAVMMISMIDRQTMGIREGRYLIVISLIMSFLISYVVAFVFSNHISKPIGKISANIKRISDGDYSRSGPQRPNTQLGRIDAMLDELADRLKEAKEERDGLERARMDFFANVSHELRTPITVMRGYAETLSDGVITDQAAVKDMYGRMISECRGMERLVGDLFTLSKMQNPDFEIEKEPVSLRQIFFDVSKSAAQMGRQKGIDLVEEMPEDDPCMMLGDYVRLRQMFLIIVDNAIKFSEDGGRITIKMAREDGKLKISIADEGAGISDEDLPFIFEKFYKSKLKQNEKGTGLGLMIAKQIALRHGGDIKVKSELGRGTTFFFAFDECTSMEDYE